jgi:4a-hydroxytetrahydrobiopterin dehydratase
MDREEAIVFRLKFKRYLDAIEFLKRVAEAAERLNHHPDVELRYVNLTLRLTTHDAGNKVTERDLQLAEEIQKNSGGVQRRASSVAPAPQPRASAQRRALHPADGARL